MTRHRPRHTRAAALALAAALACGLPLQTPAARAAQQRDGDRNQEATQGPVPRITEIKTPSGLEGNRAKVYLLQNFKIEGKNFSPTKSKNKVILVRTNRRGDKRDYADKAEAVAAGRLVLTPLGATPTLLTVQMPGDAEEGFYKLSVEVEVTNPVSKDPLPKTMVAESPRGLLAAMPNLKFEPKRLDSVTPNVAARGSRVELRGSFPGMSKVVFEPYNSTHEGAGLQPGSLAFNAAEAGKDRIAFDVPADVPLASYRVSAASSNFKSRTNRLNFGVTPGGRLKLSLESFSCLDESSEDSASDEVYVVVVACPRDGSPGCFALQTQVYGDVDAGETFSSHLGIDSFAEITSGGQTDIKSVLGDRLEKYVFAVGLGEHDGGQVAAASRVLTGLTFIYSHTKPSPAQVANFMTGELAKALNASGDDSLGVTHFLITNGEANDAFARGPQNPTVREFIVTGDGGSYRVKFHVTPTN